MMLIPHGMTPLRDSTSTPEMARESRQTNSWYSIRKMKEWLNPNLPLVIEDEPKGRRGARSEGSLPENDRSPSATFEA